MSRNYLKGKYIPDNPEKYKGDIGDGVTYRSSYEKATFEFLDRTPSVLEWSAETVVVPYFDPIKNKKRRYIVDIWMKYRNKHGDIITELVEVKPYHEVIKPVKGRKKESTYLNEVATYMTNQAKWQHAEKFAKERGWGFRVITENSIFK